MTVLERVGDFIRGRAPQPVCDDCIAEGLGLSVRQHANHKTRELSAAPGFERADGRCSICKATKKVIRYSRGQ